MSQFRHKGQDRNEAETGMMNARYMLSFREVGCSLETKVDNEVIEFRGIAFAKIVIKNNDLRAARASYIS